MKSINIALLNKVNLFYGYAYGPLLQDLVHVQFNHITITDIYDMYIIFSFQIHCLFLALITFVAAEHRFSAAFNIAPSWEKTPPGKDPSQSCPSPCRRPPVATRHWVQQSWPPRRVANSRSLPPGLRWRRLRRNPDRQSRPKVPIPLLGCRSWSRASIGKSPVGWLLSKW